MSSPARRDREQRLAVLIFASLFLAVALYQAWGVGQDWLSALRFRYELNYGEGIVWQQMLLMGGPRMYSPSPALPFIVFHYPPLFHVLARALVALGLDPLLSGRLVSVVSALVSATTVAALILTGTRSERRVETVVLATAVALLFLCLNPVRSWSMFMRVDMLSVALGLLGTAAFAHSRGSTVGMTAALLLCVASLFAKQTQLPAGISVFLVALACAPRRALVASVIAGAVGLAVVVVLEAVTGGFLKNIIAYNVNPLHLGNAREYLWREREAAPLVVIMVVGAIGVLLQLRRADILADLRRCDPLVMTRVVVVLHFALAGLMALQIIKDGADNNYFIDFLTTGCILIGFLVCNAERPFIARCVVIVVLALSVASLPHWTLGVKWLAQRTAREDKLVDLIARQTKPVISDDMLLLMRAGKSVVYEPAIVRVLVAAGRWDPAALLSMIRDHDFAFAITSAYVGQNGPVVKAAIEASYPREDTSDPRVTLHFPP